MGIRSRLTKSTEHASSHASSVGSCPCQPVSHLLKKKPPEGRPSTSPSRRPGEGPKLSIWAKLNNYQCHLEVYLSYRILQPYFQCGSIAFSSKDPKPASQSPETYLQAIHSIPCRSGFLGSSKGSYYIGDSAPGRS